MVLLLSATLATLGLVAFGLANDALLLTHPEWSVIGEPLEMMAYGSLLLLLQIFPGGQQPALSWSNGSIVDGGGGKT
jgi:hypothetical protein